MGDIILASASPRRQELLKKAGLSFRVIPAKGEEKAEKTDAEGYVMELSANKAGEISEKLVNAQNGTIIIGADTVVVYRGRILGKPESEADAQVMLEMLQGNTHQVYTGVTLLQKEETGWRSHSFAECTDVDFYPVSKEEIRAYIKTGEPMDKAGSYAIQGRWGIHVKGIRGDYNNVVGLPVARLFMEAKSRGYTLEQTF